MSVSNLKLTRDDSFDDFEFFDMDNKELEELNAAELTKTNIRGGKFPIENMKKKLMDAKGIKQEIIGIFLKIIINTVEKLGSGAALVFSALCSISEEQGFSVTVPVRAVATTAATTLTGSLVGGVPGMAVGLITGVYLSYRRSPNKSKALSPSGRSNRFSLRQVLKQLTFQQKMDLLRELMDCLKQPNVKLLITELCKNDQIRGIAIQVLSDFLFKKVGLNLTKTKPTQ